MVVVVFRPARSLLYFLPLSFLSSFFFRISLGFSNPTRFHVTSSLLSGLAGRPIKTLLFTRNTHTHTQNTNKKCNPWSPKEPPRSRAPRVWRDRWERREIQIYLFLLAYEFLPRVWISPIFFLSFLSCCACGGKSICALLFLFFSEMKKKKKKVAA